MPCYPEFQKHPFIHFQVLFQGIYLLLSCYTTRLNLAAYVLYGIEKCNARLAGKFPMHIKINASVLSKYLTITDQVFPLASQ